MSLGAASPLLGSLFPGSDTSTGLKSPLNSLPDSPIAGMSDLAEGFGDLLGLTRGPGDLLGSLGDLDDLTGLATGLTGGLGDLASLGGDFGLFEGLGNLAGLV